MPPRISGSTAFPPARTPAMSVPVYEVIKARIVLRMQERFDAAKWAALFKAAGARYVVPVAEHHDGFAMYNCGFSEWNAVKMGPKRDLIGELAAAVRKQWLVFGLSSHRAEHWWFFNGGMTFDSDIQDPRYVGLYGPAQPKTLQPNEEFLDNWLVRTCELEIGRASCRERV